MQLGLRPPQQTGTKLWLLWTVLLALTAGLTQPALAGAAARACGSQRLPAPRLVNAVPPADLLSNFAVFRRPQTPADLGGIDWTAPSLVAKRLNSQHLPEDGSFAIDGAYIRHLGSDPDGNAYFMFPAEESFARPISRYCYLRLSPSARRRQRRSEHEDRIRGIRLILVTVAPLETFPIPLTDSSPGEARSGPALVNVLSTGPSHATYVSGVAPDSASSISLSFHDGTKISDAVTGNFWVLTVAPKPGHRAGTLVLRSISGQVINTSRWP